MDQFEITTAINRPVEDVFAVFEEIDKYPDWNDSLTKTRKTSAGPLGVGTTVGFSGKLLGRAYESPAVFTEYVPNAKLASKSTSGPFYVEVTYSRSSRSTAAPS
jgi:uncharacterized protein YndB with AHSA1/START domain